MGLWNALSGKIYHWNAVKVEVHQEIYPRLKVLPPEMLEFKMALFAHYVSFFYLLTEIAFNDESQFRAWDLPSRLKRMNKNCVLSILAIMKCDFLICLFSKVDDDAARELGKVLLFQTCYIYGRDEFFTEERHALYEAANQALSNQAMRKDLSLVLGLDPTSEWELQPWLYLRDLVPNMAKDCMDMPNWEELMRKELGRPPRIGGYPDQLA